MKLLVLLLALFVNIYHNNACENSRDGGMFKNDFTSDPITDGNYVADDGGDMTGAYGDVITIALDQYMNMYETGNTLMEAHISDTGKVIITAAGGTPVEADFVYTDPGAATLLNIANQPSTYAMLFQNKTAEGITYRFTYKHIIRSNLFGDDGLATGPSMCVLQDIAYMIADCSDNSTDHQRAAVVTIHEALIITWEISDGSTPYYFQSVIATDNETVRGSYVAHIYGNTSGVPVAASNYATGFANGLWSTDRRYAAVCPHSVTTAPTIHEGSNCHCGTGNVGRYVFKTSDNSGAGSNLVNYCTGDKAELDTMCASPLEDDNLANYQMSCRPPRIPQDTCLEDVTCVATDAGLATVTFHIYNSPFETTGFVFLDKAIYDSSGNMTEVAAVQCKQDLVADGNMLTYVYQVDPLSASGDACTVTYTAAAGAGDQDVLSMVLYVFDSTPSELEFGKPGSRFLNLECSILPIAINSSVLTGGVPFKEKPERKGQRVVMFPTNTDTYDNDNPNSRIAADTEVNLGDDIFITVCLDWGDRLAENYVDIYAIYMYDLEVSNNAAFAAQSGTDTNRLKPLIGTDGCRLDTDSRKGFYLDGPFTSSLVGVGVTDGIKSDDLDTTYNFCQTTKKLDAIMWLIAGGGYNIFFRGTVEFCRNQDYINSSRCSDSCGNTYVDYTPTTRKRRDADGIDDNPYPPVSLETSIKIARPKDEGRTDEQMECMDSTVAISTLTALMFMLLVAMGVTIMLFIKLQTRQRKRV